MVRPLGPSRRWLRRQGFDIVRYPLGTDYGGALERLLRRLRIDCVLDVGASRGDWGAALGTLGYSGRIVSFEPERSSYEALCRRSSTDDSWSAVRLALSDQAGRATLHVAEEAAMSSLLHPTEFGLNSHPDEIRERHSEEVEVAALSGIWEQYVPSEKRVLLKVDTQGNDLHVLIGAGERLDEVLAVQVELAVRQSYEGQPDYVETLGFLRDRGFAPTGFFKIFRDEYRRLAEFDCLLSRAVG